MTWSRAAIVVPAAVLALMALLALTAPLLAPHDPAAGSLVTRLRPPAWEERGLARHLLGTDALGRDVLSRLIHGARVSLAVALIAIVVAGTIGSALGIFAGFLGGWTDTVIMRTVDLALSLPVILLALLFGVLFGPTFANIVLIIALVLWSQYARMARGETLRVLRNDYIDLARTAGLSGLRIMARHVLPNIAGPLVVLATLQVGTVIILEASLSFLGVGVPPAIPSWGTMIADGRSHVVSAWWLSMFPGLAIVVTVLCANLLGDTLTDRLNPTLRRAAGLA
jgi:peptide/nickel transport system permease protein